MMRRVAITNGQETPEVLMGRLLRSLTLTTAMVMCSAAYAQPAADFYKGKTIRLIVGFSTGGGYDQYARLLVRHIGRHTPGAPTYIVQNMPGAASLKSVLYLEQGVPHDGLTMVTFNPGLLSQSLTIPGKVPVDFRRFGWVGNISEDFRVCFTWHARKLQSFKDVQGAKEIVFGTTGVGTSAYIEGRMLSDLFRVNVRQVQGYPGSADKRIAIERGELDGDCGSWTSLPDDWLQTNKINIFVRFSRNLTPDMPKDITFAGDLVSDAETRAVYDLLMAGAEIGRPYVTSSGTPADRLAALRSAFDATMADKEFRAEAVKQKLEVNPITGAQVLERLQGIYASPPAAVARARTISGE